MAGNIRLGWGSGAALAGAEESEVAFDRQHQRVGSWRDWERILLQEGDSPSAAGRFSLMHEELHNAGALWYGTFLGPRQALECLRDIESDALSMGYDIPSQSVVLEAERILLRMFHYRQLSYDVYSMSKGRVAIGVNGGFGYSMLVVCEPENTALCIVTINRVSRRARYGDSEFLPDDFVKQGLRQMSAASTHIAD